MRVCHVVRQYAPSVGGLESFVASLASTLQTLDCTSDVLTLDRVFNSRGGRRLPSHELIHGVRVHRVPMMGHPRFFVPVIEDGSLDGYDVIHVHGVDGMFDRMAIRRRPPRQKLVATSHGLFFHTRWMTPVKEIYLRTATRAAAARYDLLIANSVSDLKRLRMVSDDVVHLPNGITPIGHFVANGRDVLCLGRLATHKHIERIIAALAQPELAGIRLHVVGPEWNVSQLDLARTAEIHKVADRVLLHGRVDAARLTEIAGDCALFVSASTYEGFGMSLVEAMSVGLIPVVHPNPAFVELLGAANSGQLVDFKRPTAAARAMRRQLDNICELDRRRAVAYASRFAWSAHAERTMRLYCADRPLAISA